LPPVYRRKSGEFKPFTAVCHDFGSVVRANTCGAPDA
jgi:hypothetical protein